MKRHLLFFLLSFCLLFSSCQLQHCTSEQKAPKIYWEGEYQVGECLKAGEYVLIALGPEEGTFALYEQEQDEHPLLSDRFAVNSIVTVKRGECIRLVRCVAIPFADFYRYYTIKTVNNGTMLTVGKDIPAGEIVLKADSPKAEYRIYLDSRHTLFADQTFVDRQTVLVENGQYLQLIGCHLLS